jgi:hypothetical protein
MPYKAGDRVDLTNDFSFYDGNNKLIKYFYKFIIYHRNKSSKKSQWLITCNEELEHFIKCVENNWIRNFYGWAIEIMNGNHTVIGVSKDNRDLYIIKFVDGNKNNNWHGYPADYMFNTQDKPPTEILQNWVILGCITKSKMAKVMRGQNI